MTFSQPILTHMASAREPSTGFPGHADCVPKSSDRMALQRQSAVILQRGGEAHISGRCAHLSKVYVHLPLPAVAFVGGN